MNYKTTWTANMYNIIILFTAQELACGNLTAVFPYSPVRGSIYIYIYIYNVWVWFKCNSNASSYIQAENERTQAWIMLWKILTKLGIKLKISFWQWMLSWVEESFMVKRH